MTRTYLSDTNFLLPRSPHETKSEKEKENYTKEEDKNSEQVARFSFSDFPEKTTEHF